MPTANTMLVALALIFASLGLRFEYPTEAKSEMAPDTPPEDTTWSARAEVKAPEPSEGSATPKHKQVIGHSPAAGQLAARQAVRIFHEEKAARLAANNVPEVAQPHTEVQATEPASENIANAATAAPAPTAPEEAQAAEAAEASAATDSEVDMGLVATEATPTAVIEQKGALANDADFGGAGLVIDGVATGAIDDGVTTGAGVNPVAQFFDDAMHALGLRKTSYPDNPQEMLALQQKRTPYRTGGSHPNAVPAAQQAFQQLGRDDAYQTMEACTARCQEPCECVESNSGVKCMKSGVLCAVANAMPEAFGKSTRPEGYGESTNRQEMLALQQKGTPYRTGQSHPNAVPAAQQALFGEATRPEGFGEIHQALRMG